MALATGYRGASFQYRNIVSPIAGLFGISVQKQTNVILLVKDENGNDLTGVTVSYPSGAQTVTFTTSAVSASYEVAVPASVTTVITLSRAGYVTQSFNVTVAAGDFLVVTRTMLLVGQPYKLIMKKRAWQ